MQERLSKLITAKELLVFGFEGNKFYDRQYNWEENWKAKMIFWRTSYQYDIFRCYLIQLSEFQVYSHIDVVKLGNISILFYDLQNFPDTNNSQNDEFYEAKYK